MLQSIDFTGVLCEVAFPSGAFSAIHVDLRHRASFSGASLRHDIVLVILVIPPKTAAYEADLSKNVLASPTCIAAY